MSTSGTVKTARTGNLREVVAIVSRIERQVAEVAEQGGDESLAFKLSGVLADLGRVRLELEGAAPNDARQMPRVHPRAMLCLRLANGETVEAEVYDISAGGALIACDQDLKNEERCQVEIDGLMEPIATAIRPTPQDQYHLLFEGLDADRRLALTKHLDRFFFRF